MRRKSLKTAKKNSFFEKYFSEQCVMLNILMSIRVNAVIYIVSF